MAPPAKDIPGYYYDKEKKKYFKIEGSTAPQTSAYSTQDVKRRKERDQHETEKKKKAKTNLGRPRRFTNRDNSISGLAMRREQGGSFSLADYCGILAAGLKGQGNFRPGHGSYAVSIEPLFYVVPFDARPELQVHSAHEDFIKSSVAKFDGEPSTQSTQHKFGDAGATTSLSYHETENFCAMTWFSGTTTRGIGLWPGLDPSRSGLLYGPGEARGREPNVFTSTAAPSSSSLLFAFGTNKGILTIDREGKDLGWLPGKNYEVPLDHFLALEFLSRSNTPYTLLGGCRSGHIYNIDLRAPDFTTGSRIIKHPSAVTHIKHIDEYRVVVAGLQNLMCLYDLRYLKSNNYFPRNSRYPLFSTKPIVSYDAYTNQATIAMGFDVDTECGIIAASQEGGNAWTPYVQLFSIKSGETLTSPFINATIPPEGVAKYPESPPKCLRFVREKEGEPKSLFISNPKGFINRYSWKGGEISDYDDMDDGQLRRLLKAHGVL